MVFVMKVHKAVIKCRCRFAESRGHRQQQGNAGGAGEAQVEEGGGHGAHAGECEGESDDDDDDKEVEEVEEEEEDETVPVCLFIPAGWWHWLAGDAEWHVAWSGSFFPGNAPSGLKAVNAAAAGPLRRGTAAVGHRQGGQRSSGGKRGMGNGKRW